MRKEKKERKVREAQNRDGAEIARGRGEIRGSRRAKRNFTLKKQNGSSWKSNENTVAKEVGRLKQPAKQHRGEGGGEEGTGAGRNHLNNISSVK